VRVIRRRFSDLLHKQIRTKLQRKWSTVLYISLYTKRRSSYVI